MKVRMISRQAVFLLSLCGLIFFQYQQLSSYNSIRIDDLPKSVFSPSETTATVEWIPPVERAAQLQQNRTAANPTPGHRQPPREEKLLEDTIGFVHVGKTGGSSLSLLLRNGCHSVRRKKDEPCRVVPNETLISKLVEDYYHTVDFHLMKRSLHKTFLITIRDVYDRAVSSFLYLHPKNTEFFFGKDELNKRKTRASQRTGQAYDCLATLDVFGALLKHGNSSECGYGETRFSPYEKPAKDCSALACGVRILN